MFHNNIFSQAISEDLMDIDQLISQDEGVNNLISFYD